MSDRPFEDDWRKNYPPTFPPVDHDFTEDRVREDWDEAVHGSPPQSPRDLEED